MKTAAILSASLGLTRPVETNGVYYERREHVGTYYDYLGYVEISLLRIYGGVYHEAWTVTRQEQEIKTTEKGTIGGVKLQF